MRQNRDTPGVTPFLVDHETHSTTFGFTGCFSMVSVFKTDVRQVWC